MTTHPVTTPLPVGLKHREERVVGGELSASTPFDVREEDTPDPEILYDRVSERLVN